MARTKPTKVYSKFVVVEGSGDFPIDMLRYDAAFPATEDDSHIAERSVQRRVALISRSVNDQAPTNGRWASFGWKVVGVFNERQDAVDFRNSSKVAL